MRTSGAVTRHGSEVGSVFGLLGADENDLTAALGFTLDRSPALLRLLVRRMLPSAAAEEIRQVAVAMEVRGEGGRTDLEITLPSALIIIEAKRDWILPTERQLAGYAPRILGHGGGVLATLSQASDQLASVTLPKSAGGVPVAHLSWRAVLEDVRAAQATARGHERMWLDELSIYVRGVVRVRSVADSWTYCVVLSDGRPGDGGALTFKEYVVDAGVYFHPYGEGNWPTNPPNFFAFRWGGQVRRIHRAEKFDVVPNLQARWPDVPVDELTDRPHAVYELGPQVPPFNPIPSGAQYRASRLWVLLDQLQSSPTLAEALARSKALAA